MAELKPCPFCGRYMEMEFLDVLCGKYILHHAGYEQQPCLLNNGFVLDDENLLTCLWNMRAEEKK